MPYTLTEIHQKKLMLKPNGQPYSQKKGIIRRLKQFGFKPTGFNDQSRRIYQITDEDLEKMNAHPDFK